MDMDLTNKESVSIKTSSTSRVHFLKNFPNYKSYSIPYRAICRLRYVNAAERYDEQFLYELEMQEAMQSSAYDAMRFHRHFVYTTLWPPLHTKREMDYVVNTMYAMTPKQQKRLKELMEQDVV